MEPIFGDFNWEKEILKWIVTNTTNVLDEYEVSLRGHFTSNTQ